jgi:hypothetical protein
VDLEPQHGAREHVRVDRSLAPCSSARQAAALADVRERSVLALASAEAGLAGFGYFVAYALVFERGSVWKRAESLAPQLIVLACWATSYIAGDFGVRGTSLYRELPSPLVVLAQGALDVPTWLMSLFGPSGSTLVLMLAENAVRLVLG